MKSDKQALDYSRGKLELIKTSSFKIKIISDVETKDIAKMNLHIYKVILMVKNSNVKIGLDSKKKL